MITLVRLVSVLTLVALVPGLALAGETPYNPNPKPPSPPQEWSYFCIAGIGGSSGNLYITPIQRDGWAEDAGDTKINQVSGAWAQAVRGEPGALNAHCMDAPANQIAQNRQVYIDQANQFHNTIVEMKWHYGQTGPAVRA